MIKLNRISSILNNNIYAKLEGSNPFGSIKDRTALYLINNGIKDGLINKDTIIIESTSGNTGISLAGICLYYNLKCIIVMPENMSIERIKIIESLKGKVILTDKYLGIEGCINKVFELKKEYNNVFIPSQFENINNVVAHYETTGKEIYDEINDIDILISGIGTGGTISGCGKYLKEKNNHIKIIGVEPFESAVINNKLKGSHLIQGIGAGFIPDILLVEYIDEVIMVKSSDAIESMKQLNNIEGIFVGISSGACYQGLKDYIKKYNLKNKNIVIICPDSFLKYMSLNIE
jgi:cysteine synthase A